MAKKLIIKKKVEGKLIKSYFIDIGTYANLKIAKQTFGKHFSKSSVFFDRDGVLNYDKGYTHKIKDLKFKKNVFKTLKLLNKKNINIFIVTNQSGIARGYYSEKDFLDFQIKFKKILEKKNIYINDLRYCPFHKNATIKKYKKNSLFRKPGNLMIEDLKKKWDINIAKSFMIGDKISDKLAAQKSKIYFEFAEKDIFQQVKRICKNFKI
jgi:D-glycero-D-manno-heptose 1,7-bisphosphate phosphatase